MRGVEFVKGVLTKQPPFDVALLDAFAAASYAELDYENEARNQERFAGLIAGSDLRDDVRIPEVEWSGTSRKVLTTAWIEGEQPAKSPPDVIRRLTPVGVKCFLAQLLDFGFFHSDPHPGNLLVDGSGKLVLIDFGLCAELDLPAPRT